MTTREGFLKRAAFAGLLLVLPRPVSRRLLEPDEVPGAVAEYSGMPGAVPVYVRRGNAASMTYVSREFIEDATVRPFEYLALDAKRRFLLLQENDPGRATMPVRDRRRYRLELNHGRDRWLAPEDFPPAEMFVVEGPYGDYRPLRARLV